MLEGGESGWVHLASTAVRYNQKIELACPPQVCEVSRRAVMVGLWTTIRAAKLHAVLFLSGVVHFSCAVFTQYILSVADGDRRGGTVAGQFLMQINATVICCYELLFYSAVMNVNGFWEALAVRGVRAWTSFCPRLSGRVLNTRTGLPGAKRVHRRRPVFAL